MKLAQNTFEWRSFFTEANAGGLSLVNSIINRSTYRWRSQTADLECPDDLLTSFAGGIDPASGLINGLACGVTWTLRRRME